MDFTMMSEQELFGLVEGAEKEIASRQTIAAVNKQVADVIRVARRDGAIEAPTPGDPWAQPTDASNAYMAGDVQTHSGKTWESTVDYNVWEPGMSGWREKPEDGSVPEFVQPTGQHDAYNTGELVTFENDVYKALQDGLVWSPTEYPQGWELQA